MLSQFFVCLFENKISKEIIQNFWRGEVVIVIIIK